MPNEGDRAQRKVLGKGLSALLPNRQSPPVLPAADPPPAASAEASTSALKSIPLEQIEPNGNQPRSAFDQERLEELAHSLKVNGLLQPITVQPMGPGRFRIIAGERRWRAAKLAGFADIAALVRNTEEHEVLELALIENIQREDLNPIEIAKAFQSLADQHGLQHEQIAERTGKDRSTITNFLRLLRLSPHVQQELVNGRISAGHARALLNLPERARQEAVCQRVIHQNLSVRATERLVKDLNSPLPATPEKPERQPITFDANIKAALEEMASSLGTKIVMHPKTKTTGKLEIEYYSQEDLDRIYSVITKQ